MKKTCFIIALFVGLCTTTLMAQNNLDSALVVTEIAGEDADADTTKSSTWTFNSGTTTVTVEEDDIDDLDDFFDAIFDGSFDSARLEHWFGKWGWMLAMIPILIFFILPLLVVLIIVFAISRGRKAKFRAYEQMAERGQDIPQGLQDAIDSDDIKLRNDGVRTICTGIGLAILLGVIMDELGVGIGALVFLVGVGKYAVYWMGQRDKNKKQ